MATETLEAVADDETLLTIDEAAALLRIHPQTIRGWIRTGLIEPIKIGGITRIPRDTLLSTSARSSEAPEAPQQALVLSDEDRQQLEQLVRQLVADAIAAARMLQPA